MFHIQMFLNLNCPFLSIAGIVFEMFLTQTVQNVFNVRWGILYLAQEILNLNFKLKNCMQIHTVHVWDFI